MASTIAGRRAVGPAGADAAGADAAEARFMRTTTVLLIEDDDDFRELLEASLRRDGFQVLPYRDAPSVVPLLSRIDVIVVDQRLPGRDGLSVLAELRALGARVPALLMSGFADAELARSARALGAIGVFAKPFDLDDLRTALRLLRPPERAAE
jgi:two-component system response regulator (stage 0 sporulation protein F)